MMMMNLQVINCCDSVFNLFKSQVWEHGQGHFFKLVSNVNIILEVV